MIISIQDIAGSFGTLKKWDAPSGQKIILMTVRRKVLLSFIRLEQIFLTGCIFPEKIRYERTVVLMQRHLLQQKGTHRIDIVWPVVLVRLSESLIMVTSKIEEKSSFEWSKIPLYLCVFLRNILYNFEYTAFLLSLPRARQVYRTESLHPPGYPMTGAVFRAKVKETRYMSSFLLSAKRQSCCQLTYSMEQSPSWEANSKLCS
jgi:hypothetical protein